MSRNTIVAIPLTDFNSTGLSGSFQAINTGGLPNACNIVRVINNSTVDVTISYDGSTAHDFIAKATSLQLPLQSNALPNSNVALVPKGTIIYVKGSAGSGLIYLAGYYQPTT